MGLAAIGLVACTGEGTLVVSLRTDYAAGTEVREARLTIDGEDERAVALAAGTDLLEGARLAQLEGVAPGDHTVTVRLVGASGRVLGARDVRVRVDGAVGVTVVITRDCAGVVCPAGDPALSACLDGRCVDPACTPEAPERCPPPACAADGDCAAPAAACGAARCQDGVCFELGDDAMCGPDERCDPARGCRSTLAGPCESALDCPLFASSCAATLDADRCLTTQLMGTAPTQWLFDLSGRACEGAVGGASTGLLTATPALFRDGLVWNASRSMPTECLRYDVSLVDGTTSLTESPCGDPVNLGGRALGWIDRVDDAGAGVLRVPGEADRPFTLPFSWTGSFALGPRTFSFRDLDSDRRAILDLETLEQTLSTDPAGVWGGAWRDRDGSILWLPRAGRELVRTDDAGVELERIPIAGLPDAGPAVLFVGLVCTF